MAKINTQAEFMALLPAAIADSTLTFKPYIGSNNPAFPFPQVSFVEFRRCIFEKGVLINFQEFDKIRFNDCKISEVLMVDGGFAKSLIFDNAEPSNHHFNLSWRYGAGCDELRLDGYRNIGNMDLRDRSCKTLRLANSKVNTIVFPRNNTLEDMRFINSEIAHIIFD